ncbi:DUF421 domain-containing protein [Neobacillus sp. 19]|uniref:DUF421 domain-containing protein n=1 Tax=Neobacillus sp. 19 TaxID=3394458 RepID=UPI003BF685EC
MLLLLEKLAIGLVALIIIIRLMGKKELAQITTLDFAFAVILADLVANITVDDTYSWWHMIVAMCFWVIMIFILDWFTRNNKKFERLIQGEPQVIILHGKINRQLMKKERMTKSVLETMLRQEGIFDIDEVRVAFLEVDGKLSVLKRGEDIES